MTITRSFERKMPFRRGFHSDDVFLDIVAQTVEVSSVPNVETNEMVVAAVEVLNTIGVAAFG